MKRTLISALLISGLCGSLNAGNEPILTKGTKPFKKNIIAGSGSSDKVIGAGVQFTSLKLLAFGGTKFIGFGVNALYSSDGEKNAFFGDYNYFLPGTITTSDYANAFSSSQSPTQVDIEVKTKISAMAFRLGYRRYFIQEISEDGFKMYAQAHGASCFLKVPAQPILLMTRLYITQALSLL